MAVTGHWTATKEATADNLNASLWQRGAAADRPAFGQQGRVYTSYDTMKVERDTGAAWELLIQHSTAYPSGERLLLESGDSLLLENGDFILKET